jgi:hypothetical protein
LSKEGIASNSVHVIQYCRGHGWFLSKKECGNSFYESNLSAFFNTAEEGTHFPDEPIKI